MDNKLFNSVFNNIFIKNNIDRYIDIINQNEKLNINSIMEFNDNPYKEYCKYLYVNCNDPLVPKGVLIDGIEELVFSSLFNQPLNANDIPSSVKILDIQSPYVYCLETNSLRGLLPASITSLKISNAEQPLRDLLPPFLKKLALYDYDIPFEPEQLPSSITELYLQRYQHKITHGILPSSIEKLTLSFYNHEIKSNDLPSSIKDLSLHWYDKSFKHLPPNLERLTARFITKLSMVDLPKHLIELNILSYDYRISNLPATLQFLIIQSFDKTINKGDLPLSLKALKLGSFNQPISSDSFPPNIETINMGLLFNQPISFSSGLTALNLGECFNSPLSPNSIPSTCKILILGNAFRQVIKKNDIPDSIEILSLASRYDSRVPRRFTLRIPKDTYYEHPLNRDNMPKSLKILAVHRNSNTNIIDLPDTVKIVHSHELNIDIKYLY